VRLFESTKGGSYYRDLWLSGRGKSRRCIGTTDRAEAERIGRELLAALLKGQHVTATGVLPLGYLWQRYRDESPTFLDNGAASKTNDEIHADVLLAYFGEECDVRTLTENDQRAFVSKRLAGGIKVADRETGKVRSRTAEAETKLLHTMLRWATTVRAGKGQRLLADNPLQGVRNVREENPLRPVATWERFTKTREAARQLTERKTSTPEQRREWIQLELALVIAEATGRRLGSIRQLRWDDWDFERHTIRWRGVADKKGHDAVIPVPESLISEVMSFRVKLGGAFGGLVFPSVADRDVAMSGDKFSSLLKRAERHAKQPKLEGGLWHAYRRAWATSRKHLPVSDVAAAGGWKDLSTLLRCYTQADNDTILAVMSEPKKVMEKAVSR
jgi:integrase